jgi:hypothetical protein
MSEDAMADDDEKAKWPGSNLNRAKRSVKDLRAKLSRLKEWAERGRAAESEIAGTRRALDVAESFLSAQARQVATASIPALRLELNDVCMHLDASYDTGLERRLHEILSMARSCGASGQSAEQYKLASARIKSGSSSWRWTMFVDWIRSPAEKAA